MTSTSLPTGKISAVKLAMLTRQLRSEIAGAELLHSEPIAIIGMDCRFPGGANSPEAYWQLLQNEVDAIREAPVERWGEDAIRDLGPQSTAEKPVQWGGFIDQVDQFDPYFFGISPREAISMDPQHRLLLEVTWNALERAGQPPQKLAGSKTGVFASIYQNDFSWHLGRAETLDAYTVSGNAHSLAVNRLSYLLDLQGPSLAVDTACSSSLVAVHLACSSLRTGECDLALAGGVNLILVPASTEALVKWGMLAADGRCKTFDTHADGFVRGEGCGVVVLKRLANAIADGDNILAVIRGTAVNQDGRTNVFTAPNGLSQQAVIRQALRNALVEPAQVNYVETHGTGTALGDPIEVEGLSEVYSEGRSQDSPCVLGAVKTNIGHLEAAAGIAGLIKTVLCLQHQAIPANLHFTQLNQHITLDQTQFVIPQKLRPWPAGEKTRYAGVSSFGMGGTNAHVILEEAPLIPRKQPPSDNDRPLLLPVSARSPAALRALAQSYATLLENTNAPLAAICATASLRRAHHPHRLAVVGNSPQAMAEQLRAWATGQPAPNVVTGLATARRPRLAFAFPGQGSQWRGMGRQLLQADPTFRTTIEACAAALAPHTDWSLLDQLAGRGPDRLNELGVIQPVLWAMQVALAAVWQERGLRPDVVIGHSMGEVAAATVAGMLPLSEAARLIARRSRLLQQLVGQGVMALVELPVAEAMALLAPWATDVAVAVCNSPRSCVLAGAPGPLAELLAQVSERGVFWRYVKVDVASHSPQVDAILPALATELGVMETAVGQIPLRSTVRGTRLRGPELTASYWVDNLRQPVQFWDAVATEAADGPLVVLEVSPHPILAPLVAQGMAEAKLTGSALGTLRREQDELAAFALSLAELYVAGVPLAWERLVPPTNLLVNLPTYPWQRERFWPEPAKPSRQLARSPLADRSHGHPLLGEERSVAYAPQTRIFEHYLDLDSLDYLRDHSVQGVVIFPAAGYIELCLAALRSTYRQQPFSITDMAISRMLTLQEEKPRQVQVVLHRHDPEVEIQIYSRLGEGEHTHWQLHVRAKAQLERGDAPPVPALSELRDVQVVPIDVGSHYQALAMHGLEYGPAFRAIEQVLPLPSAAFGRLQLDASLADHANRYNVHPVLLDACFQLLAASAATQVVDQSDTTTYLPVGADRIMLYAQPSTAAWGYVRLCAEHSKADAFLLADDGAVVFAALGLRLQPIATAVPPPPPYSALYVPSWQEQPHPAPAAAPDGTWLVFSDASQAARRLLGQLRNADARCVCVVSGNEYQQQEADLYHIDPSNGDHFVQLFRDVAQSDDTAIRHVLYLWGATNLKPATATVADFSANNRQGVIGLLHLVQALTQAQLPNSPRLWVVTRGAQAVTPDDTLCGLAQAPLWGLTRTLSYEIADLRASLIDLDVEDRDDQAALLMQECLADSAENQIAVRNGRRYVARLAQWDIDSAAQNGASGRVEMQSDGTYLVVGGLSGLGLATSRWLAEQGARHLVLVGRRSPSPAAERVITELQSHGVSIVVRQTDIADAAQTRALFAEIDTSMPALRGIIHSAAVLDDGLIVHQNEERFKRVMAAKIDGSWNLHCETQDRDLDFFVLFSSGASIMGSPGQANYAAANAFQDGLVAYRRSRGLPGLAINWGPWSEIGQAAAQSNRGERLASQGVLSITPQQGLLLLEAMLATAEPQIAVLPLDVQKLQAILDLPGQPPLLVELVRQALAAQPMAVQVQQASALRDKVLKAASSERGQIITDYLLEQVAEVLRISAARLDAQQPINLFGIDSLMALELKRRIEFASGSTLSVVQLLQGPSIADLATEILRAITQDADVGELREQENASSLPAVALPLVALQPHGDSPPFFCVHGAMGYAYGYAELARHLGNDQPVYGLEAVGLDGRSEPFTLVEEMSAHYLTAIRTVQPSGPYFLGGASFGGVIAFEMARQLVAQGERVALLALIDSIKPSQDQAALVDMDDHRVLVETAKFIGYFFGTTLAITEEDLAGRDYDAQIDYIVSCYQAAQSWPAFMDVERTRTFLKVFRAILFANKQYQPGQYNGTITFFRASDGLPGGLMPPEFPDGDLAADWAGCSTVPMVVHTVAGDHVTMVKEPHVRELARLLRAAIDNASE